MPQININEIDESVFTRVVTDDLVRTIVPGIASFGPVGAGDEIDFDSVTFTDVTEFEKTFGYNEPEYNPFKHDVSRIYAKQLMNRGAAVTFVRVNTGYQSAFDMGTNSLSPAALHGDDNFNVITTTIPDWSTKWNTYYNKVDGTYSLFDYELLTSDSAPDNWGTSNTFYTRTGTGTTADPYVYTVVTFTGDGTEQSPYVPAYEKNKYYVKPSAAQSQPETVYSLKDSGKFCPQIQGIKAKYTGSFGNRLLVTFTPVVSQNRNFAYQYSTVTVYRADVTIVTSTNEQGIISVTKQITGVHKLESHSVTTNPDDINYFANPDLFKYIIIEPTASAFDELSLIWSNLAATPVDNDVYSGFPEIPLRYSLDNGMAVYNTEALLTGGTDFIFDEGLGDNNTLQDTLGKGFGGYSVDGTNDKVTKSNINRWIWACYRPDTGIISQILDNIASCYENYEDPYIYDFDFITAGGFVDETYTIKHEQTIITTQEQVNPYLTDAADILSTSSDANSDIVPTKSLQSIHSKMLNLVNKRQDCIALIDTGENWKAEDLPEYVRLLNSSYAAVHAPWCYCNNPYASGIVLMPPSFIFLYTMMSNLINNTEAQKWFPPAGVTRATARVVVRPKYEIGSVLLDKWQNNTLSRVNPIMKLKSYGYVIYGQYTAYIAPDVNTHSALESLNVRLISNCVKKQIFNTCLRLAFEPNNSSLWMRFYDAMDKYLIFMKRNDGLYGYRIQMDEGTVTTDDINELRCPGKVWISPTRTAEFFDIDFILTDAGVTFTDTTEEGE